MRKVIYGFGNKLFGVSLAKFDKRTARTFEAKLLSPGHRVYTSRNDLSTFVPGADAVKEIAGQYRVSIEILNQAEYFLLGTQIEQLLVDPHADQVTIDSLGEQQATLTITQPYPDTIIGWVENYAEGQLASLYDLSADEWSAFVYEPLSYALDSLKGDTPHEFLEMNMQEIADACVAILRDAYKYSLSSDELYTTLWRLMIAKQESRLMHAALARYREEPDTELYLWVPYEPLYRWILDDGFFPEAIIRVPDHVFSYMEPFIPIDQLAQQNSRAMDVSSDVLEMINAIQVAEFVYNELGDVLNQYTLTSDEHEQIVTLSAEWASGVLNADLSSV